MKRFLITLFIIILIPISVCADEMDSDEYDSYLSQYDLSVFSEYLNDDTYDVLKELGIDNFNFESLSNLSPRDISKVLFDMAEGRIATPLKGTMTILVFVLLSAFFQGLKLGNDSMNDVYSVACAVIISILLILKLGTTISFSVSSLKIVADFIYAFIPVFCAIVATGGGITTTLSTNTMLLGLAQGLSFLSSNVLMPLINCFLALGICTGLSSTINLSNLISSIKRMITKAISLIAGAFVSILSIKTNVSARADILGIRSIRFVINSVVPIIGPSISEGLFSIQSYSSLIKSSVGIVGIIAVAFVFLPSIIEVVFWRVSLTVCLVVSDMFGENSVSKVIGAFKDALLLLNVILIFSMVTTIISIGILIAAKTA